MGEVRSDQVLLEAYVEVCYTVDDPPVEMPESGKHYPITIKDVLFRGDSIMGLMYISHILLLQRRVFFKLKDEGKL